MTQVTSTKQRIKLAIRVLSHGYFGSKWEGLRITHMLFTATSVSWDQGDFARAVYCRSSTGEATLILTIPTR